MEPNIRADTRTVHATGTGPVPAAGRDTRGFWRVLLAVIAPLPVLAKGIFYAFSPVDGSADFRDTVTAFAAHRQLVGALTWLDAAFVVGLVPATVAVAWAARRGAPRLTTAGAIIALPGFLAGIALLGGVETPALVTARYGLNVDAMAKLNDALSNEPLLLVASLLFIAGIVLGLALLGIALWRSRVAPAWMGIALAVGGATHPFIPGHVAQGVGLVVAAVGFAGASLALLRMSNDEFDLPPVAVRGRH
jgi:hypothetical protein